MSWLQALGSMSRKAASLPKRRVSASTNTHRYRFAEPVGSVERIGGEFVSGAPEKDIGSSASALLRVSDSWQGALQLIQFSRSELKSVAQTHVRHSSPRTVAECVAVLLEAGKGLLALELLRAWVSNGRGSRGSLTFKRDVKHVITQRLRKSIETLGAIGDVETLRLFISFLHTSLLEQRKLSQYRWQKQCSAPRVISESEASRSDTHKGDGINILENSSLFLSMLGVRRIRLLLVSAVHELIIQECDVVPLSEKLTWINAVSMATPLPLDCVSCIIPCILQEDFQRHIEGNPSYNEQILRHIGPALCSGFRSLAECDVLEVLWMPRSELRWARRNNGTERLGSLWSCVKSDVLPQSEFMQNSLFVLSMVDFILNDTSPKKSIRRSHAKLLTLSFEQRELRKLLLKKLRSPRSVDRRLWGKTLLRHPRVLCRLDISPLMVFGVCALTFRSYVCQSDFLRYCLLSVRRMRRSGCYEEASRLVWNHISHYNPLFLRYCAHNPQLVEEATEVLCRTMRRGLAGRREPWMGYRSLAFLRVQVAARGLAPDHCIPVCAGALDCGVHFATVQNFILDAYKEDLSTGRWVLNMVRLVADRHMAPMRVALNSSPHSRNFRGLLRRVSYELSVVNSARFVEVRVPSRSKLLALWTIVNDKTISDSLKQLTCRLFLDVAARGFFKEMHLLVSSGLDKSSNDSYNQIHAVLHEDTLTRFLCEEVFLSVAANCTTEQSFSIFLRALMLFRQADNKYSSTELTLNKLPSKKANSYCRFVMEAELDSASSGIYFNC